MRVYHRSKTAKIKQSDPTLNREDSLLSVRFYAIKTHTEYHRLQFNIPHIQSVS